MPALKTSIIFGAVDKLTAPMKKITASTGRLADAIRRASKPTRDLTARQRDLRSGIERSSSSIAAQERRMRAWSGTARKVGTLAKWAAGAALGLGYAFKRTFIDTAAAFERFETILETIEGSSEKARAAMDWISDFAVTTPFELGRVTDAFVKLRAYGMDPTDGLLRTLGDTSSAMGKDLMQAVEAVADAVTGENERLKEFGIKARAAGGKIRYEYTVDGETKIAEALASDRAQIQEVLTGIFNLKFGGAMEKQSKTFTGMISNLMDQWTRFQKMVMNSGAFDLLKEKLGGLLKTLNGMAADRSLQEIAERVGKWLVDAFQAAEGAITQAWPWVARIGKAISWAAEKMGGWGNLAVALSGLYLAKPFIGLAGSLGGVVQWSGKALGGLRKMRGALGALAPAAPGALAPAAPGIASPGAGMLGGVAGKLASAGAGIKSLIVGLAAVPGVGWAAAAVVAAVAAAAVLIYKYWEPLKAFFSGVWEGFKEALQPAFEALEPLKEAFAGVGEAIAPVVDWFAALFAPVEKSEEQLSGIAAAGRFVGNILGTILGGAIKLVVGALGGFFSLAKLLLTANPLALAAKAIYQHWEPLTGFFKGLWQSIADTGKALIETLIDGLKAAPGKLYAALKAVLGPVGKLGNILGTILGGAIKLVVAALGGFFSLAKLLLTANPLALAAKAIYQHWEPLTGFFKGLWQSIADWFESLSLADTGKALIETLIDGLKAAPGKLYAALKAVLGPVGKLLPASDAREGPLSRLTAAGGAVTETLGAGVLRAGPYGLRRPLAKTLGAATASLALTLPAASADIGPPQRPAAAFAAPAVVDRRDYSTHTMNVTIEQQPGEDARALAERVMREIEQRQGVERRGNLYDDV